MLRKVILPTNHQKKATTISSVKAKGSAEEQKAPTTTTKQKQQIRADRAFLGNTLTHFPRCRMCMRIERSFADKKSYYAKVVPSYGFIRCRCFVRALCTKSQSLFTCVAVMACTIFGCPVERIQAHAHALVG